ncbi:glycosyltransferase [Halorubrum ezzemoulense]|uniref:glycosyltransferase n=1 Tax=Halorubrum ezzemoulense TaxID=337243 RepID=UPI00232AA3E5|nr:glycosyltransferase [Halorubrum ezzemoulense]MDB2226199.1 glycosyltransferase [Halorubrum ezzemoulense]
MEGFKRTNMTTSVSVLYIVSTLERSGPTNQLFNLVENLGEDVKTTILTLSPEPKNTDWPRFREAGYNVQSLSLTRLKSAIYGPYRLRKKVAVVDPDLVHTQGIRADSLSAFFLTNYPRVATVRNYPLDDYPELYGKFQGHLMARHHLCTFSRLDHPIGCSKTIADLLRQHGISAGTIQNGVNCEVFRPPADGESLRAREELNLSRDGPIGVSVGGLIPRKDPQTVVRGFLSSEEAIDGQLVFLGDGPLREDCERIAADAENIRFEGRVEEVETYLKAADYFVSASKSEGLPNAVMEALASGLPVCLSDIPQHREILEYDHNAGVIFDVGEKSEVADQLDLLAQDNDSTRRSAARQLVENYLSANRMASQYQEIYRRIAGSSNPEKDRNVD